MGFPGKPFKITLTFLAVSNIFGLLRQTVFLSMGKSSMNLIQVLGAGFFTPGNRTGPIVFLKEYI